MGSGGSNRDMYYLKNIETQPTPERFLMALRMSPYSRHKKASKILQVELKHMKLDHAALIKEYNDISKNDTDGGSDDQSNSGPDVPGEQGS